MRFQVPQFIEVEDKIIGPLTFKQFLYIGGGVGVAVVCFVLLPKFIAVILGLPFAVLGFALAFYKVNDRPLTQLLEDFLHYSISGKLYVWKKEEKVPVAKAAAGVKPITQVYVPKLSQSKLKDLSVALDTSVIPQETGSRSPEDQFKV